MSAKLTKCEACGAHHYCGPIEQSRAHHQASERVLAAARAYYRLRDVEDADELFGAVEELERVEER